MTHPAYGVLRPVIDSESLIASVLLCDNPGIMTLDGTNTWVLRAPGSEELVVVAPRPDDSAHIDRLSALGRVSLVLISHRHGDHTDGIDKIVVDDWGQCKTGKFGSLRRHVETGRLSESNLHGELGEIVCGSKRGRESDEETNLLWHRGLSLSDIALGHAMLVKARRLGVGQKLRFS